MTAEANPRLAAALAYAARGWHVLPCLPRLKVPATSNGLHDASLDPERIRAWWRLNPNYNVAIATGPSNLFVVDIDPGGEGSWEDMLACDPALASVATHVRTPRGGSHIYMVGEGPTTASKIAQGIDTRGAGGYVLAPPSYVDDGKSKGHYTGNPETAALPPVHAPLLAGLGQSAPVDMPRVPEKERQWDAPETLIRAKAWLSGLVLAGDVAVEGAGGDAYTFEVCCKLLEMAVTPDTAFELLSDLWNPHCSPPWSDDELKTKIGNAWKYGQETKGAKAEWPIEETFKHFIEAPVSEEPEPDYSGDADLIKLLGERYTPMYIEDAIAAWKEPEWLLPGIMTTTGIGLLYGPARSLKTFLALDLAASLATGHGPNWWQEGDREPRDVIYLAGESPHGLVHKRYSAWMARHMLPGLRQRSRLVVVQSVPPIEMWDYWRGLVAWIRREKLKPALFVIDTMTRAMTGNLDNNSDRDVTKVTSKMEWLSRELGCFVMGLHHTGKDVERGIRGSQAWEGNTDMLLGIERPSEKELNIRVHLKKVKEAADGDMPLMFNGALHGEAPAFTRDWNPPEPTQVSTKVIEQQDSEEWLGSAAVADELAKGPLHIDHLADSLSSRFGVNKRTVKAKLKEAAQGRYRTWNPYGETWVLPDSHPAKKQFNEEQF